MKPCRVGSSWAASVDACACRISTLDTRRRASSYMSRYTFASVPTVGYLQVYDIRYRTSRKLPSVINTSACLVFADFVLLLYKFLITSKYVILKLLYHVYFYTSQQPQTLKSYLYLLPQKTVTPYGFTLSYLSRLIKAKGPNEFQTKFLSSRILNECFKVGRNKQYQVDFESISNKNRHCAISATNNTYACTYSQPKFMINQNIFFKQVSQ